MAVDGNRTGRRRMEGEAPVSDKAPEDEAAVNEAEAEPSVTEGIYFSKVPSRDTWHAHDEDHDHVGTVYRAGESWHVKAGGKDMPAKFGSAASGRAFLSGHHLGFEAGAEYVQGEVQRATTHLREELADMKVRLARALEEARNPMYREGDPETLARQSSGRNSRTAQAKEAGTNATHDADA